MVSGALTFFLASQWLLCTLLHTCPVDRKMETCQGTPVAFHEVNNVHPYNAPMTSELSRMASFISGVVRVESTGSPTVTNYLSEPCSTTERVVELYQAALSLSQRRQMKGGYRRSQPLPSMEQGLQPTAPLPQGGGTLLGGPQLKTHRYQVENGKRLSQTGCVLFSIDLQAMFG